MNPNDNSLILVRVKDVILDDSHPEYNKYGKVESIGIIKYAPINKNVDTSNIESLPPAFPLNQTIKTCPLVNELVFIVKGVRGDKKDVKTTYYLSPLSIFNETNFNGSYDILDNSDLTPGYEFIVKPEKRPIYPFHGDVILQGRHGQSIRFTGARSFNNPFSNSTNQGSPLTIFTNGHQDTSTSELYVEDINKDETSIYFTSNHTIPLDQVRDKYAGAVNRPVLAKNFTGKQVIVNSGRLYFNAYDDDILFSCQNNFGVSAKQVSIDGVDSIGLDAKKIYLGERALRFELQPVLLGNQMEVFLDSLLGAISSLADALKSARTIDQKAIPSLNVNGYTLGAIIKGLKNQINPNGESLLKSKKVFTE